MNFYNTAIYTRLSREDIEENTNETMQTQIDFVTDFVQRQDDLVLYSVYTDNGYAGTNFDRPEFDKMMQDITKQNVNCIIVKDFSRFGRNYVECGYFFERTFPEMNIRFISINDNYDSLTATSSDGTVLSIKNMVNNMYVNDISKKTKTALKNKQSNGEYLSRFAPYGYLRSKEHKNKLVVNEEVADNVRKMFELRAEEKSYTHIAKYLNENKILSPTHYNATLDDYNVNTDKVLSKQWRNTTVSSILENEVYIGNLVYNKTISKRGTPKKFKPQEEWKVIEDNHEPIVDKELFYEVQDITQKLKPKPKTKKNNLKPSVFTGIVCCSDCKTPLTKNVSGGAYYFYCAYEKVNRGHVDCCSYKRVTEPALSDIVLDLIRQHVELSYDYKKKIALLSKNSKGAELKKSIDSRLTKIEKSKSKLLESKTKLIEKHFDEEITLEEFISQKAEITNEETLLDELTEQIERERIENQLILEKSNKWINNLMFAKNRITLDRKLLELLIDKIYLYSDNTLEVVWKFQDEFYELKATFDS